MPENRFFHPHFPFEKTLELTLDDREFHHLRVMRLSMGDTLELVNGHFQLARGKIIEMKKESALISLFEVIQRSSPFPSITLVQALPQLSRLEWIIEKCTELGVSKFWFFPGDHSEKKNVSENQIARFRMLSISAMKQCGRLDLPTFEWHSELSQLPKEQQIFFGDPHASMKDLVIDPTKPLTFCIGPEKGWTENEKSTLLHHFKAKPVRLHCYTLRSDTAAISSISLLTQKLLESTQ